MHNNFAIILDCTSNTFRALEAGEGVKDWRREESKFSISEELLSRLPGQLYSQIFRSLFPHLQVSNGDKTPGPKTQHFSPRLDNTCLHSTYYLTDNDFIHLKYTSAHWSISSRRFENCFISTYLQHLSVSTI